MIKKAVKKTVQLSKYVMYKETLIDVQENLWSFVGTFLGIGIIAFVQSHFLSEFENVFLIGSFGASAVLIFGAIQSPLSQPRNLVGGHLISAFIGVTVFTFLPNTIWITAPLAVALSVILMQITKTLHPPGGATALIAVIGTPKIKALGYYYVISPVFTGVLVLLITALLFNNITPKRKYPTNSRLTKHIKRKLS